VLVCFKQYISQKMYYILKGFIILSVTINFLLISPTLVLNNLINSTSNLFKSASKTFFLASLFYLILQQILTLEYIYFGLWRKSVYRFSMISDMNIFYYFYLHVNDFNRCCFYHTFFFQLFKKPFSIEKNKLKHEVSDICN